MTETRDCRSCKQPFAIEPEDFDFYKKINVPPPTWCSQCRYQRRMSWRNTWHLFKKRDAHTHKETFSLFPEESPVKIYEQEFWNSDGWDPMEYGRDYDFKRSFLAQLQELFYQVPLPAHSITSIVNSEYCTNANGLKGCYLVRASTRSEDSLYLILDYESKRCMDSHMTVRCELSVGNLNCQRCYKTFFSVDCDDCQNVIFSKDCVGCNDCFGCIGLRNKSYHIFNQPYTKETYAEEIAKLDIGSAKTFAELKQKAYAHWKKFPHKFMHGRQNANVSGDYISESKNAHHCYRVRGVEDSKYCANFLGGPSKNCYDYMNWGENTELVYETLVAGMGIYNVRFCWQMLTNCKNMEYSIFCRRASDCFGCVGVRDKQYCILNKQYPKEEYEKLRTKIIEHMNAMPYKDDVGREYRYGEFFPPEFSPFPYEATEAYEFFPMETKEAEKAGFVSYLTKRQAYTVTLPNPSIPDHIKEVKEEILNEVLECAHKGQCREECTGAFRIVKAELEFYRQFNLPLPRLCINCRHYERLAFRNPPSFHKRQCQCAGTQSENGVYKNTGRHSHGDGRCAVTFETSYAPERPEIVYCESCYQQEVV